MTTQALRPCTSPHCRRFAVPGGSRCRAHQPKEADRPNVDVRTWYRTSRWRQLRAAFLQAQPWCPECRKESRFRLSTDVDHVIPHRGDPALFWDVTNLRALCHQHHSAKTGRGL